MRLVDYQNKKIKKQDKQYILKDALLLKIVACNY